MIKLVNIKDDENLTIVNKIYDNFAPTKIYLPINDKLKINDYVYKNTYFNNDITSISGYVTNKCKINNKEYFEITNDYKENTNIKLKKIKIKNKEDLTHVLSTYKLNNILNKIHNIKNIDNLVISSIDEEVYSINEFGRLSNNYTNILDTIDLLINVFEINDAILTVKNTNFNSIKNVKSIIGTYPKIKITLAPDKYLINYYLCEYLNLNKDNTLILTTNEIYDIYSILNGKYITEHLITISGNGLEKSKVINTRLGTSLQELIKEHLSILDDNYEVFINGYLKGYKLNTKDIVITKDIEYIVIKKCEEKCVFDCINCGACHKICPKKINVKRCFYKKLSHKKCIGCGLCNYICPSNIDLKKIVEK